MSEIQDSPVCLYIGMTMSLDRFLSRLAAGAEMESGNVTPLACLVHHGHVGALTLFEKWHHPSRGGGCVTVAAFCALDWRDFYDVGVMAKWKPICFCSKTLGPARHHQLFTPYCTYVAVRNDVA